MSSFKFTKDNEEEHSFKIIGDKYIMLLSGTIVFTFEMVDFGEFNISMDGDHNMSSDIKLNTNLISEVPLTFKDGEHIVNLDEDTSRAIFFNDIKDITYEEFIDKVMVEKL